MGALLDADLGTARAMSELLSGDLCEILAELLGDDPSTAEHPDDWVSLMQDIACEVDLEAQRETAAIENASNPHLDLVVAHYEAEQLRTREGVTDDAPAAKRVCIDNPFTSAKDPRRPRALAGPTSATPLRDRDSRLVLRLLAKFTEALQQAEAPVLSYVVEGDRWQQHVRSLVGVVRPATFQKRLRNWLTYARWLSASGRGGWPRSLADPVDYVHDLVAGEAPQDQVAAATERPPCVRRLEPPRRPRRAIRVQLRVSSCRVPA